MACLHTQQAPLTCLTNHIHKNKGKKGEWIQIEYVTWPRMVSWNWSVLTCSIIYKDKIMVIIQLIWLQSTKLNKLLIILMTVISICLLIFQGSGDDAALAKMLKVIRFLVGHLVHLVKVKICSSLSLFCWHYVGSLGYIFLLLNESLVHSNYYCLVLIYLICSIVFLFVLNRNLMDIMTSA